jgi:hypothetical protein
MTRFTSWSRISVATNVCAFTDSYKLSSPFTVFESRCNSYEHAVGLMRNKAIQENMNKDGGSSRFEVVRVPRMW